VRLWFAVLGGPGAWALLHVFGFGVTVAACGAGGRVWGIPVDGWTIAATAAAAAIAVLAELAALSVFRATSEAGSEPPASRIHFMSIIALTINPLFACIVVMNGVGVAVLQNCHAS